MGIILKKTCCLAMCLIANLFTTSGSAYADTVSPQNNWSSMTTDDVNFTYKAIKRIAPYTYFQSEPKLGKWLLKGYKKALDEAQTSSSYSQYKTILSRYLKGFNIEHLSISFPDYVGPGQLKKPSRIVKVTSRPFLKNGIWIKIPSFMAGSKHFKFPQLSKTLKKLNDELPQLRQKSVIVFDVRGNGGGSSALSRPLIVSLYSKQYLQSLGPSFIWNKKWRVIDSLAPDARSFFNDDRSMVVAAHERYRLYESTFWPVWYGQHKQETIQHASNPVKARVIILADKLCASMCYEFTRTLLDLPNTVLVGQAPNVMNRLTNPTSVLMPSHKATLHISTREIISPAYAFGRHLQPKYQYLGDINNTPKLEKWIAKLYRDKKI